MLRLEPLGGPWPTALKAVLAGVWLVHGMLNKILSLTPRHERIVARVLGEGAAGPATLAVGALELCFAAWIVSGRRPALCAAAQTVALAGMNVLELAYARDLLLAPLPMVCANAAFLGLAWYGALAERRREPS